MGRAKAAAGTRARMSNTEAPTNDDPNKRPITGTWDGMDTKMLVDLKHIDVKEFIATCRLTYTDPENPKPSQGKLTFILNRKHYSKTLFEICDMYGFTKGEAVEFPKLSSEVADDFWNTIATRPYQSRKAKISILGVRLCVMLRKSSVAFCTSSQ